MGTLDLLERTGCGVIKKSVVRKPSVAYEFRKELQFQVFDYLFLLLKEQTCFFCEEKSLLNLGNQPFLCVRVLLTW